ncbi:MAG: S8 family serine peptidase, partial [Anaerolineales bacterium]
LHGTITTSVINGLASFGQRQDGAAPFIGHRYALGLAPASRVRVNKYFDCSRESPNGFAFALRQFDTGAPVNVVNLSFADPQCKYTSKSVTVDDDTFTRARLFTISAGNTTDAGVTCSSVRGPATAKNAIAVGATDNFTINWGPMQISTQTCGWSTYSATEDARNVPAFSSKHDLGRSIVKPDLVAPGVRITGPYSRYSGFFCNGDVYGAFCKNDITDPGSGVRYGFTAGTSFAAPAVAGAASVVRRWYRNVKATDPSPAMTKAILINGARDLAGAVYRNLSGTNPVIGHIPDIYQGWGMLNLTRLLGPGDDYYFFDEGVELLGDGVNYSWQKFLFVRDGSKDIRITLVWSEPSNGNGKNWPINDLDITADQFVSCPCWYGNQLSSSSGYSLPVPPNPASPDRGLNNVEQIIIPAYTYSTGSFLRLAVILNYSAAPPVERQKFAVFADNASETSAPPRTYFYTVTPCRIVDTRGGAGHFGGPALDAIENHKI